MCHATCSSAYFADFFSTELVIFVCLFTLKVCGAKRETLMNFLGFLMKQEVQGLKYCIFACFVAAEHQSFKTGKCCMSELMV